MQSSIKLDFSIAPKGDHFAACRILPKMHAIFAWKLSAFVKPAWINHKICVDNFGAS